MTPSQLEAARLRAEHLLTRPTDEPRWSGEREMLETFLSATTPPSEEELAEEAMRKFPDAPPGFDAEQHDVEVSRDAYIAGARRGGAR
jgi:hypothetical protein